MFLLTSQTYIIKRLYKAWQNETISTEILLDLSTKHNQLFKLLAGPTYKSFFFENQPYYGYFYIEEKEGKKKIVAYMIFYNREDLRLSTVHFLLVDKEYRNKNISKALVSHYIKEHRKQKFDISVIKDAECTQYWQMYGYIEDPFHKSDVPNHTRMICSFDLLKES